LGAIIKAAEGWAVHSQASCRRHPVQLVVRYRVMVGEIEALDLAVLSTSGTSPRRPKAAAQGLEPESSHPIDQAPR
jgi:hypothetical protein